MIRVVNVFKITFVIMSLFIFFVFYYIHDSLYYSNKKTNKPLKDRKYSCSLDSCPVTDEKYINVHVIPTSHLDISSHKTFDEYYTGTSLQIDPANVKGILDTVLQALLLNSSRKFVLAEMAYFQRWWNDINDESKINFRKIIESGQFQFASGGFVINDEATTHYMSIIDQMTLGLNFIKNNFGICARPTVGWQIDSFGHSKEMANLMSKMNLKALFLNRIPYKLMQRFKSEKNLEFLWKTSDNNTTKKNEGLIFTSVLSNGFCTPSLFCVDYRCKSEEIEMEDLASKFIYHIYGQISLYKTRHILLPLGCDFNFQNAVETFENFDQIMNIVHSKQRVFRAFYSTPSCYAKSVLGSIKNLSIYSHDFFPYDSPINTYWVGFYSSRPTLKLNIRQAESEFQTCKKITSVSDKMFNRMWPGFVDHNLYLSILIAKLQHHDTITGTSPSRVIQSNLKDLFDGLEVCRNLSIAGIESIMSQKVFGEKPLEMIDCPFLNVSYCSLTDDMPIDSVVSLIMFNPLPYSVTSWVYIPVSLKNRETYEISDVWNMVLRANMIPIDPIILNIKDRPKTSKAKFNVLFKAILPEMGFTSYTIKRKKRQFWDLTEKLLFKHLSYEKNIQISNSVLNLYLDLNSDRIKIVKDNMTTSFYLDLKCHCVNLDRARSMAGIYVSDIHDMPKQIKQKPFSNLLKGSLVQEIRRRFNKGITLTIRLYEDESNVEIEWFIGGIMQSNNFNREYVIVYTMETKSNGFFYTDSNGRQLIKRQFKYSEHLESNFYPITSHVLLNDLRNMGILIHTDRSVGVGGIKKQSIEFVVNRIILTRDKSGSSEKLQDIDSKHKLLSVIGKQWIEFGNFDELKINRRIKSNEIFSKPIVIFQKDPIDNINLKTIKTFKSQSQHLNILTLKPLAGYRFDQENHLMRLENLKDISSNNTLNMINTLKINLDCLFENFNLVEIVEMNLSGDQELKLLNKLTDFNITLKPMDIRTFRIKLRESLN